jgi:hypothetical protein
MSEKPQQPPSYPLRMPQDLREQLAESAKKNNRSVNAEIIFRLESSFSPDLASFLSPEMRARVEENAQFKRVSTGIAIASLLEQAFWSIEDYDRGDDSDEDRYEPPPENHEDDIFAQAVRKAGLADMYSKVERTESRLEAIEKQLQQVVTLLSEK